MSIDKKLRQYLVYWYKLKSKIQNESKNIDAEFKKIKKEFYTNLWTETAREVGAEIKDIGFGYYQIYRGSHSTYINEGNVMLDSHVTLRMAGNKPFIFKLLKENNYPVNHFQTYDIHHLSKALQFVQDTNIIGVIKPAESGAGGKGITTGITSWDLLKRASYWATCFSDKLMIEKQIDGHSYRLLYLNGEFLDAIVRKPPKVIGDSKKTIKKLIEEENQRRLSSDSIISLSPITIDLELTNYLNLNRISINDIPAKDEVVSLKRVVNQNSYQENESVKETVHDSIVEMGAKISKLLNVQLAGIDIISDDLSAPFHRNNLVINEVNTTPGLHHHYLIYQKEKITPVAQSILKFLLKN